MRKLKCVRPVSGATALVWSNGGVKYVCATGYNALDGNSDPYLQVAACVVAGDGSALPTAFPGTGGSPLVVAVSVNTDGTFSFGTLATFLTGAASVLSLPGSANTIGIWAQNQGQTWGNIQKLHFYGKTSTAQTSCGTG